MSKIIDSFNFFNEFNILKLRLNYLNDVVDNFIICESNHTYSYIPKPYYLDEILDDFSEDIRKKIIRIQYNIDSRYHSNDPWVLEHAQRNFIGQNLDQFSSDDIIMISDVDEIPRKEIVNNLSSIINDDIVVYLQQEVFVYNFFSKYDINWLGTNVSKINTLRSFTPENLRAYFKYLNRDEKKNLNLKYKILENGGWHFTYMGDYNFIKNKINSFAHQEFNTEEYTNKEYIENCIQNKKLYYDNSTTSCDYSIQDFPNNIRSLIINLFPNHIK